MAQDAVRLAAAVLWRWLYSDVLRLVTPYALLRWWWRGRREPLYRLAPGERFGRYGAVPMRADLWLHAVSLGETRAAAALLAALRSIRPELVTLLTHGTATGREAGVALLQPGDRQVWMPWDTPGSVRRFMVQHRPRVGVLMETEVWPNLLRAAQAAAVPMVLANARLSERSQRRAAHAAPLLRPALRSLTSVLAQTDADAARLLEAGARAVQVVGNLKFDVDPDPALQARGHAWRAVVGRPVVVAASTREGEEALLLAAWMRLAREHRAATASVPDLLDKGAGRSSAPAALADAMPTGESPPLLVIVPRHPQRFDAVWAEIVQTGATAARRSAWDERPDADAVQADVWLGDSVGEMPVYYGLADVALLGGSFAPFGGQNLIEAAACGCPVLLGPSTHNFAEAADLAIADGAAVRVADIEEAVGTCCAWIAEAAALATRSTAARRFAAAHGGAARRMAVAIDALLVRAGAAE